MDDLFERQPPPYSHNTSPGVDCYCSKCRINAIRRQLPMRRSWALFKKYATKRLRDPFNQATAFATAVNLPYFISHEDERWHMETFPCCADENIINKIIDLPNEKDPRKVLEFWAEMDWEPYFWEDGCDAVFLVIPRQYWNPMKKRTRRYSSPALLRFRLILPARRGRWRRGYLENAGLYMARLLSQDNLAMVWGTVDCYIILSLRSISPWERRD